MFGKKKKEECRSCEGHGYTSWVIWKCTKCGNATQGSIASFANGPVSFIHCRCGNRINVHQQTTFSAPEICSSCGGEGYR